MKKRSPKFTFEMAATAKWLVTVRGYLQHQAAALVGGVNPGRVCEALKGKRHPDAPIANLLGLPI